MKLEVPPPPEHLINEGLRLDGRGCEEFRSVCEWAGTAPKTWRRETSVDDAWLPLPARRRAPMEPTLRTIVCEPVRT